MIELERTAGGEAAEALKSEAAVLEATDIAGLPAIVSSEDGGSGEWVLTTAVPAGVPLRDKAPAPPEHAAGIVLAVAAIASDLARAGIRRHPFTVEQVHLAAGVRPTLRHLSGARFDVGATVETSAGDLGRLLHALLPAPPRRTWRGRDDAATRLRRVAHRAADPAMKVDDFIARVREAVPGACLPRNIALPSPQHRWSAMARRRRVLTALIAAVAVAAAATGMSLSPSAGSARRRVDGAGATAATTGPDHPGGRVANGPDATGGAVAVWPRYGCPTGEGTPVEIEGQPCPMAGHASGSTITAGSSVWQVIGEGSYVTALGDWDCSGRTRAAALDVVTGEVWIFEHLPVAGAPAVAAFAGKAPGAVGLVAAEGCGPLAALAPDGTTVTVDREGDDVHRHPGDAEPTHQRS